MSIPYSLVDSEAFKRLNFTDPHSPQKYNLKSEKVTKKYKIWLLNVSGSVELMVYGQILLIHAHLSLTGHFIVGPKRLTYTKILLGAQVLEKDHTVSYTEEKLRQMIDKWNIGNKLCLTFAW